MLRRTFTAVIASWVLVSYLGAGTLPRQASPQFAVHLTNGQQVTLSQFQGKAVALIFILSYCPHCQAAVASLAKAQTELGARGFQTIASIIEENPAAAVPDFVKRFHPPFPVGFNDRNPVLEFLQHAMAARLIMPQLVFIDKQGMIRAQYSGDDPFFLDDQRDQNIRGKVQELLSPKAPASHKK